MQPSDHESGVDEETVLPKSKYEEDVYINNHTCVWGSWWKDHQWGYKIFSKPLLFAVCAYQVLLCCLLFWLAFPFCCLLAIML
ncbi:pre-mRNA-splicing factor SLU7-like isoform X3 [Euphorbia lathyris]|uniref:pre-mRNA-splicing factor SLU7-like isoform X3 n=1 Tax=Euphorbia lathyris TaxID=212925 RepID=UPI0033143660